MTILQTAGVALTVVERNDIGLRIRRAIKARFGTDNSLDIYRSWPVNKFPPKPTQYLIREFVKESKPEDALGLLSEELFVSLPKVLSTKYVTVTPINLYGSKLAPFYYQLSGDSPDAAVSEAEERTVERRQKRDAKSPFQQLLAEAEEKFTAAHERFLSDKPPNSIGTYRVVLNALARFLSARNIPLAGVNNETLHAFLEERLETNQPATVKNNASLLNSWFSALMQSGLFATNPMAGIIVYNDSVIDLVKIRAAAPDNGNIAPPQAEPILPESVEAAPTPVSEIENEGLNETKVSINKFAAFDTPLFRKEDVHGDSMFSCLTNAERAATQNDSVGMKGNLRKFVEFFYHRSLLEMNEDYLYSLPLPGDRLVRVEAVVRSYRNMCELVEVGQQERFNPSVSRNAFSDIIRILTDIPNGMFSPRIARLARNIYDSCGAIHVRMRIERVTSNEELLRDSLELAQWFNARFGIQTDAANAPAFKNEEEQIAPAAPETAPVPLVDQSIVAPEHKTGEVIDVIASPEIETENGNQPIDIVPAATPALEPAPAEISEAPTVTDIPAVGSHVAMPSEDNQKDQPPVLPISDARDAPHEQLPAFLEAAGYYRQAQVKEALVKVGVSEISVDTLLMSFLERQRVPAPFIRRLAEIANCAIENVSIRPDDPDSTNSPNGTPLRTTDPVNIATPTISAVPEKPAESPAAPSSPSREPALPTTPALRKAREPQVSTETDGSAGISKQVKKAGRAVTSQQNEPVLTLAERIRKLESDFRIDGKQFGVDAKRELILLDLTRIKNRSRKKPAEAQWEYVEQLAFYLTKNLTSVGGRLVHTFWSLLQDMTRKSGMAPEPLRSKLVKTVMLVAGLDEAGNKSSTGEGVGKNPEVRDLMRTLLEAEGAKLLGLSASPAQSSKPSARTSATKISGANGDARHKFNGAASATVSARPAEPSPGSPEFMAQRAKILGDLCAQVVKLHQGNYSSEEAEKLIESSGGKSQMRRATYGEAQALFEGIRRLAQSSLVIGHKLAMIRQECTWAVRNGYPEIIKQADIMNLLNLPFPRTVSPQIKDPVRRYARAILETAAVMIASNPQTAVNGHGNIAADAASKLRTLVNDPGFMHELIDEWRGMASRPVIPAGRTARNSGQTTTARHG